MSNARVWKEFKIETVNVKQKEMGIENSAVKRATVDLYSISGYYETTHSDDDLEGTTLLLDSGDTLTVLTPYNEIKKILSELI